MSALNNRFGKGKPPCMGELQHTLDTVPMAPSMSLTERMRACVSFSGTIVRLGETVFPPNE